jgi:formamidase
MTHSMNMLTNLRIAGTQITLCTILTKLEVLLVTDRYRYGTIKPGEAVKIECVDWTGGQIGNNDSADDVRDVDLTKIHYLTGPFEIETAEPGDVLVVEIQDVQPMEDQPWGFTGIFAKENGGGFLDEHYPKA